MSSILETLGISTRGLTETVKPFLSWVDSPVSDWDVTLQMLTTGQLIELAERAAKGSSHSEVNYLSKVHLLAMSIKSIQGQPVATTEDVDAYNKKHGLMGTNAISLYDYKVLLIKDLSELVVNFLTRAYDDLQERYMKLHLGTLPTEASVEDGAMKSDLSKATYDSKSKDNAGRREASGN